MSTENGMMRSRRHWLVAGAATAAGLAGAGLAWWRLSPRPIESGAEAAFWRLSFQTPEDATLTTNSFQGRPLLLNFWATWCPPCIDELPLLDAFFKENSGTGWQVLGLAVDQVGAVREFLRRQPLTFPVAMAGMDGATLSKSLGNLSGGLPFSVVLGKDGLVRERKIGKLTPQDLEAWRRLE